MSVIKAGFTPVTPINGNGLSAGFYPYRNENGINGPNVGCISALAATPSQAIAAAINNAQGAQAGANPVSSDNRSIYVFFVDVMYDFPTSQFVATILYAYGPGDLMGLNELTGKPPKSINLDTGDLV